MDSIFEILLYVVSLVGASVWIAVVVLYFKRRRARKTIDPSQRAGSLESSPESSSGVDLRELERAERELGRLDFVTEQENLLKTHVLLAELSTRQGHTRGSISELETLLLSSEVPTQVRFQAYAPIGFGDSILTENGDFQIFVASEKRDRAQEVLDQYRRDR